MARITPPSNIDSESALIDDDPYQASITALEIETKEYKGKMETQLIVDWTPAEYPSLNVRDYVGLRLGRAASGQVSKLRMLLNAIADKPKTEAIAWFDDETLEWSYDGTPYGKLEVGMCAIFRGEMTARTSQDGEIKRRFVIVKYSPDSSTSELVKEEASARRSSKPALPRYDRAPVVDPDEVPF